MNTLDRKTLVSQLMPFADIRINSNEIRIQCERFDTPRFIELEKDNVCRQCPPDVDYLVAKDGIYVLCDRLRGGEKFVPFDHIYELPQYCAFRVRGRKLFKFVHVFPHNASQTVTPTSRKRQHCTTKKSIASNQDRQKTNPTNDAPILTTVLPHLDSLTSHTIPVAPKQEDPQDIPILTTVLPHLMHGAQEEQQQPTETNWAPPMPPEVSIKEEQQEDEDGAPLLTTVLPHLISHQYY